MFNYYKGNWDYCLRPSNNLGVVVVQDDNKRIWDRVVADYVLELFDTIEPTHEEWQEAQHQARPRLQEIFKAKGVVE